MLVAALLVSKLVQAKGCFTKILIVGSNASLRILHSLVSALERLLGLIQALIGVVSTLPFSTV